MLKERGIIIHAQDAGDYWADRLEKSGLNVVGIHPAGGHDAHRSMEECIRLMQTSDWAKFTSRMEKAGIAVEYEMHALSWILERERFEKQPEWFRMDEKGERTADFNLCASNPEALEYVAQRTAMLASLLNTGVSRYFYWLDDVTGCACHCAECRRLSPSDQQLKVVNAMLAGLRRVNPQARLCYIAYHDAMDVPRVVEPLDGVFLEYAPINRDFHRPINDPACEKNRQETRSLRELIAFFGTKNSRVLEYWMDNSLYSNWTRPPKPFALDEDVMKADVDFYRSLGFETITSFGCFLGPDYEERYGKPPLKRYGELLR